jgi:hypothetical protein
MNEVEAIFAAARQLRDELVREIRERREVRRLRRNEMARIRYAENKTKPKIIEKHDDSNLVYEGCTCFLGHPPCSYCENHSDDEVD